MGPRLKMSLFIILILITIYLFFSRIQFIQHRKAMDTKLSRVLKGNLQTRLFTSNDHSLHNIVFSINELIAKLEQVQIEAKRSEESRKQLLSSISHDIRTPLTSIIGYIDALKDGVAASEIEKQEYLKILYMKSNNLKHLVDEIFNMAKLEADAEYKLHIWDQGPGIPKHDLQNIFERMYRSEQSRNSSFSGSGLGLSISKALVEKNGGHIWVESTPWKRTTFGFSVPKHNTFKK